MNNKKITNENQLVELPSSKVPIRIFAPSKKRQVLEVFHWELRAMLGFNPNEPVSVFESSYWNGVKKRRKRCFELDDNPTKAIDLADTFDKQYFLERHWNKLSDNQKVKMLGHTFTKKTTAILYGFDWWIPYFKEVGFFSDFQMKKPNEPIVMYRGASEETRIGMSWTDYDIAKVYAEINEIYKDRNVYKVELNPELLLAAFFRSGNSIDEKPHIEYVVNFQELKENGINMVENIR